MDGTLRGSFRVGVPSSATVRATPDTDVLYSGELWVDGTDYGVAHTTDPYTNGFDGHIQIGLLLSISQDFPVVGEGADYGTGFPGSTLVIRDWMIGTTLGGSDIWELTDGADLATQVASNSGGNSFDPLPTPSLSIVAGVATATFAGFSSSTPLFGAGSYGMSLQLTSPDLGALPEHDLYFRVGLTVSPDGPPPHDTVHGVTASQDTLFLEESEADSDWSARYFEGVTTLGLAVGETSDFHSADSGLVVADATDYVVDVLLHREYPLRGRFANSFRAA